MMAHFSPPKIEINCDMKHSYVEMRLISVNMQHIMLTET